MDEQLRDAIQRQLRSGREAIAMAEREQKSIRETVERSRRVRARAIPALRRAGYLR